MSKQITVDLSKLTEQERWSFEVMDARFDLIKELIGIAKPVEQHDATGKTLFHAVSLIQLENKRREMLPDYNTLQAKAAITGEERKQ